MEGLRGGRIGQAGSPLPCKRLRGPSQALAGAKNREGGAGGGGLAAVLAEVGGPSSRGGPWVGQQHPRED